MRGYHHYKTYCNPKPSEKIICSHERDNPFDVFAIRACNTKINTVGHLPRELSRVTKFLLEIGADIIVVLTERSPLVQGKIFLLGKIRNTPYIRKHSVIGSI